MSSSLKSEMDDEFHFLLCEWCQSEVKNPKLLPCLHNFCTECLEENKAVSLCPICGTPHSQNAGTPEQNNLLFANLQTMLNICHGKDVMCDSCMKEKNEFWCSDCKEFLCFSCFGSHQRYLKGSHEVQPLNVLREGSSKQLLVGIRAPRVMSCSSHKNQRLSCYCSECRQCMCSTCALQDSKHTGQHRDLQTEIQRRQDELQGMSTELKEKKSKYFDTCKKFEKHMKNKEEKLNETKKQLQEMIGLMTRLVQKEGEMLLKAVEEQHNRDMGDTKEKIEHVEGTLKRMESSERLVEKMRLYALGQEVIDMHPFIRDSLEELKRKQLPTVDYRTQPGNLTKVKTELQALFERMTGAALEILKKAFTQDNSVKSQAKRKTVEQEEAVQTPPKVIKMAPDNSEWKTSARQASWGCQEQPGTSSASVGGSHAAGSDIGKASDTSSWFPSYISESTDQGASSCSDSCPEEESSDEELLDASLLEDADDKLEGSQTEATKYLSSIPMMLNSGQEPLVFFDMKNKPGKICHLVAVGENSDCFSVMIQPQLFFDRGDAKASLCEQGLDNFLCYLQTLHMPILVGYNLWSMDLPTLVNFLEAKKKEERFEASIFGFLDAASLIKQKIPNAPNTLKKLHCTYLSGKLDATCPDDCARTVKDLCSKLGVNQVMEGERVIPYSSLRCYISLQPLLKEKLLSKTSARTLALHNVDLSKLQLVYQENPGYGLQRFCQAVNSNLRNNEKKIRHLSKIRSHFQALSFATQLYTSAGTN